MALVPATPEPYPYQVDDRNTLVSRVRSSPTALTAYLSAYGLFADGIKGGSLPSLQRALKYLNFLDTEFGLGDFPDVALLAMAVRQSLPPKHPDYRESDRNKMFAVYQHRSMIGSMRSTIIKNAGSLNLAEQVDPVAQQALWGSGVPRVDASNLVDVAAYVPFNQFEVGVDVHDGASAVAGWALLNALAGDFDRAYAVLDKSRAEGGVSVGEHTVWLVVWFLTARWGDARAAAGDAKAVTRHELGIAPGSTDDGMFLQLSRLANTVAGFAELGLGNVAAARSYFAAVTLPEPPDSLSAWASYGFGLAYRVGDDMSPSESANLIGQATGIRSNNQFTAALNDPTWKFRETSENNIAAREDFWDPSSEPDPDVERKRQLEDMRETYRLRADKLLESQIGMENVKTQVKRMIATIAIERERERRGGTSKQANYNLVLTGPPGTGKSTIVDALALYFASLGIVDDPEPMVTHRANYVAETVGGSAIKTRNTIESAKGKVLFFDEFYSIVQVAEGPNADQFGKEALDTIVAEAETRIGQLVFIIAGYESDIDRVVRVNEGLNSRFPRRIDFQTYSLPEIAEIVKLQASRANLLIADDAVEFLADINGPARSLLATNDSGEVILNVLGNGRFARNLVETAAEFQANRLMDLGADVATLSDADLSTLSLSDVENSFNQHLESALRHG